MPKLIAIWGKPADAAAFDADYEETHAKLAAALPGVTFEGVKVMQGDKHRVAILSWDSMESFQQGMGSQEIGPLMEDAGRLQETYGVTLETLITE
ncbi:MAG TPA: EthD family reductase [Acidimicrobiales bacterium]|jgi:uncharacterized protein (TIGR02118 family)|nr:EthD family reductase [Acidimicrobiales bacterium]